METETASHPEVSSDVGQAGVGGAVPHSWEPMLCSEAEPGQAPLSLELLLHSAQVSCPADALVAAAHLLMLETGFTAQVRPGGPGGPGGRVS